MLQLPNTATVVVTGPSSSMPRPPGAHRTGVAAAPPAGPGTDRDVPSPQPLRRGRGAVDYVVTAGLAPPVETPELDALQREGVAALLDRQLALVEGVVGPDDKDIDVLDYRITVHPDGA